MIFAELKYDEDYADKHFELVEFLKNEFDDIQYGLQGDSWIWIFDGDEKVAIDTFYSMKHQVMSTGSQCKLVHRVLTKLSERFELSILDEPEYEPHEG